MIYNASNNLHKSKAKARFEHLMEKGKIFELTEKKPQRTISQNSYAHLLFSSFAEQTGYTVKEVKQEIFKKIVNPTIFYEGSFKNIERWKSTADLDKGEMTTAVNRFLNYAAAEGYYLPIPSDLNNLTEREILEFQELEQQINSVKEYI